MMKAEVDKGGSDRRTMRSLFLIVFNRFLFCTGANITNEHLWWTREMDHFNEFDWCQLVYNDLCMSVSKWHSRDTTQNKVPTVYGCCLVILLYYLDHLYDNAAQIDCGTPRIKYFDKDRWDSLIKADHKDGRWGSCAFRSRTVTCYAQDPPIYVPTLRPYLGPRIRSCPAHIAQQINDLLSHYDSQVISITSSWEQARKDVVQELQHLREAFGEMIDQLLLQQNQEGDAGLPAPDAAAGGGADGVAPDAAAGGEAAGDATDAAAGGGSNTDQAGDGGGEGGANTEPRNEGQNADPNLLQKDPNKTVESQQVPEDVPSNSADCPNIPNEGGNQENGENAVHMEEELQEDEPTDSMEFSNLESLNSQCVNNTRGGREYDCNTSEYNQGMADEVDMLHTQELAEKYNIELEQKQAGDQPKLHENIQEISSPARQVEPNIQNSPASPSCSTMTSPTRFLNLNNTQGNTPTKPSSASFLEGDSALIEEMDRTCGKIYKESYLEDGMEMGDNINEHGKESAAQNKTQEHQPCTQGPIFDQTPVQKEAVIEITQQPNEEPTYTQGPMFDQTPVQPENSVCISTKDDGAKKYNQPSQDVLITKLVSAPKPTCFNFDIGKCRELRSMLMDPECKFDSDIILRFGGSFAKQINIVGSFADGTCVEQLFIDFFTQSLQNDEKFRDGRIVILDTACSDLLNWENQWHLNDPAAEEFDKARVINQLKKRLPQDMKKCKILYVPILDRGHWYLLVVNGPADVVEIVDCYPYEQVGTDPYTKFNRPVKLGGKEFKWAPRFIGRMSAILHEVRPKIGIPKFGRWEFRVLDNMPIMETESNDCGFYTMLFMKYYDPHTHVITRSINQEMPGDLRCLVLTYLMYHQSNEVGSLPPAVEALRQ
ncbi:unnamed protein product [Urochloa decumbens]|uniref:Ubiquitin-like protease family profile domain-containing protein n=1 Tax=Urochloa decumbens TaxID=240449 RepID=A0ABC9CYW0_9POAL